MKAFYDLSAGISPFPAHRFGGGRPCRNLPRANAPKCFVRMGHTNQHANGGIKIGGVMKTVTPLKTRRIRDLRPEFRLSHRGKGLDFQP